ncbi:hypothetical protein F383_39140 [Gossypium arboreum]|uniref:Uncharacterized protein n=1 Tax=Gossypium arboreum TaxID=29729 RepID=A0A0B0MKQ2_GOSAR|nr:hypothetical protein F383_39140 [Gossypium arboreum]
MWSARVRRSWSC